MENANREKQTRWQIFTAKTAKTAEALELSKLSHPDIFYSMKLKESGSSAFKNFACSFGD